MDQNGQRVVIGYLKQFYIILSFHFLFSLSIDSINLPLKLKQPSSFCLKWTVHISNPQILSPQWCRRCHVHSQRFQRLSGPGINVWRCHRRPLRRDCGCLWCLGSLLSSDDQRNVAEREGGAWRRRWLHEEMGRVIPQAISQQCRKEPWPWLQFSWGCFDGIYKSCMRYHRFSWVCLKKRCLLFTP